MGQTAHAASASASDTPAAGRYRRRVLLADPDRGYHAQFRALLAALDCDLLFASNGIEALTHIRRQYVDFVCSACTLPDMGGIALCKAVRAATDDVCKPFVLLSADADDAGLEEALPAGVTDVFDKAEGPQLLAYIRRFPMAHEPIAGRILYVEDSRVQRAVLASLLRERGLEVDDCASAEQAWRLFQENVYDLVLTDIVLEGPMSGAALVNRIRRLGDERGDVPVIAVTAFPDKTRRTQLSNLGVTDHILKPVGGEEMLVRIRSTLALRRYAEEIKAHRAREHAAALSARDGRFQALFSNMPVGAALIDLVRDERGHAVDYRLTEVNAAFLEHTGMAIDGRGPVLASDVIARRPLPFLAELDQVSTQHRALQLEPYADALGRHFHVCVYATEDGHLAAIIENITERKRAADTIAELAFHDQLTGLPNRTLLMDRIGQALKTSRRTRCHNALLLIDLDNFKTINDTHGHDVGDLLLREVAQRLQRCVRPNDTIARLGGDEFVVILIDLDADAATAANATEVVGAKLLTELDHAYQIGASSHRSSASIGATLFGSATDALEPLLKQADLAMYKAKDAGRNRLCFFDPAMETAVRERSLLEEDLRQAVIAGQFELHYQPQVDADGRVAGAEALLRWRHPERGMVSPVQFIPVAEQTGMILPIGHWVLETACRQLAAWAADPLFGQLSLAVNVSARQFALPNIVEEVLTLIAASGAPVQRLKLELTESLLFENTEDTIAKMQALRQHGIGFALDDFGTGYSSLAYLKRLPLTQLKIDRSFVRDVLDDASDAAIARTIVALAHSLDLKVIAEGVETEAQRDFLTGIGCPAYQGYLFSPPVARERFETLVRERA